MGGPYVDLYVLCPARSEAAAQRFLREWAPARIPSAADYVLGDLVVTSADEVLRHCDDHPHAHQRVYWESGRGDEVEHVMLFFTGDGGLIAGLSVDDWERPRDQIAAWLARLARATGARVGYVTAEEPPVTDGQAAFRAECARRELASVDGAVTPSA